MKWNDFYFWPKTVLNSVEKKHYGATISLYFCEKNCYLTWMQTLLLSVQYFCCFFHFCVLLFPGIWCMFLHQINFISEIQELKQKEITLRRSFLLKHWMLNTFLCIIISFLTARINISLLLFSFSCKLNKAKCWNSEQW